MLLQTTSHHIASKHFKTPGNSLVLVCLHLKSSGQPDTVQVLWLHRV